MDTFNLYGLGVALITPFTSGGEVDYPCLEKLVLRLLDTKVDYIVVLGTTAETPVLSQEERHEVMRTVVEVVAGRMPLVLGFGGNDTAALCRGLRALDATGFSAILSVTPFYNKPTQEGLYQHFKKIAEASPLPVILYNVPGRTGVNMTAATTLRLAREVQGIIGINEASGNMEQIREVIAGAPAGFRVTSGDDGLTVDIIESGGSGVISVIGNVLPSQWRTLTHAALDGDMAEARDIHARLEPLLKMIFAEGNPSGVKGAMASMGLTENVLRLPLVKVSDGLYGRISDFLGSFYKLT